MTANGKLFCSEELRRQTVRAQKANGIDYVEVIDDTDQTKLCVHFFSGLPEGLKPANVVIKGGRRIRDIAVKGILIRPQTDPELEACLEVSVDKPGDFSTYTLCIVELDEQGKPTEKPLSGLDSRYACADFSFKAGCPSDLDCKIDAVCPPEKKDEPDPNYLAKDYASFRRLLLDRLALIMPDWQERHAPDLGITLVELLAYAADYLSYYQDAVATEAYLDTARERISVRRHARLVDYRLHEGCNARAWVSVETDTDTPPLKPQDLYFITRCPELASAGAVINEDELQKHVQTGRYEVFEPLLDDQEKKGNNIQFFAARSTMYFYTWGDEACCLPQGAMKATLRDTLKKSESDGPGAADSIRSDEREATASTANASDRGLEPGDVLMFEEVKGPKTGNPADADPGHRHAVRLIKAEPGFDALYNVPIIELEWAPEDALPFPLCISSRRDAPDCDVVENVSVVRGNVILTDHGRTLGEPKLGTVETESVTRECACDGSQIETTVLPKKFAPVLKQAPLTFSQPLSSGNPATGSLTQDPRQALPQITLKGFPESPQAPIDETDPQWVWIPKYDLLESTGEERSFVAEMDNDRRGHFRFGDGELGKLPEAGMKFSATYRVGNGPAGNIGAESIALLVLRKTAWNGVQLKVRNPLPALGGKDPEPLAEAKLRAPHDFDKRLKRAITAEDYAYFVKQCRGVQAAGAALQWTGSWYEARVAFDPLGTEEADEELRRNICGYLHPYRRMGHDLSVKQATYVPLLIELHVCVLPNYLRGHVEAALLQLFSNRVLADGSLGLFHPDKLTFGEGIYLSALAAAAQATPGVESVAVRKLERLYEGPNHEIENGILPLGPTEVARLDNDPSFPENGKLTLIMGGGR